MQRADYEKLRWRATRRGWLEHDLFLDKFLKEKFDFLNEDMKLAFAQLVDWDDVELRQGLEQVSNGYLPEDPSGKIIPDNDNLYQILLVLNNFIKNK